MKHESIHFLYAQWELVLQSSKLILDYNNLSALARPSDAMTHLLKPTLNWQNIFERKITRCPKNSSDHQFDYFETP